MFKRLFIIATMSAVSIMSIIYYEGRALAVPACPEPVIMMQPDGGKFKAYIKGDEFQGWTETEDGYTVGKNTMTGMWEYMKYDENKNLKSTGIKVEEQSPAPQDLEKHIKHQPNKENEERFWDFLKEKRSEAAQPAPSDSAGTSAAGVSEGASIRAVLSGSKNYLVIMVQFADRALFSSASSWYDDIFSLTPGAKSTANFYKDNSFGALLVNPVPHTQPGNPPGIITVSVANNHPNSGSNFNYLVEVSWINAALAQAANYINFPAYDTNKDGTFQNSELVVYFICAGFEAAQSGNTPNIWAHAWGGSGVTAGGINLTSWALEGELNSSYARQTIGVMVHELGHSMCGLPDLYDTSYTNRGLGTFSTMAYGSWGKAPLDAYQGSTPVALDAWSRQYLGWSAPRMVTAGNIAGFGPALASRDSTIKQANPCISASQYFLAENRYPTGWDEGLESILGEGYGGGILILHVDDNIFGNRYVPGGHQGVMAEEASSIYGSIAGGTSYGNVYHLFWDGNNNRFSDDSAPDCRTYDGTPTRTFLHDISARGTDMSASIGDGPFSYMEYPASQSVLRGQSCNVTGTAWAFQDMMNVEISCDGITWHKATDNSGNGSWSSWYCSLPLPADGSYTMRSRATDMAGNIETSGPGVDVVIDNTTPPVTTANPVGGSYDRKFYVTLTANEDATIYYAANGDTPTKNSLVYNLPIPVSKKMVTIKYFAVDPEGNEEAVKSQTYYIDRRKKL